MVVLVVLVVVVVVVVVVVLVVAAGTEAAAAAVLVHEKEEEGDAGVGCYVLTFVAVLVVVCFLCLAFYSQLSEPASTRWQHKLPLHQGPGQGKTGPDPVPSCNSQFACSCGRVSVSVA